MAESSSRAPGTEAEKEALRKRTWRLFPNYCRPVDEKAVWKALAEFRAEDTAAFRERRRFLVHSDCPEVAGRMRDTLRRQDVVGRMGGEEFLIVLPATGIEAAREIAERLRTDIEAGGATAMDGRPMPITVSVGVSEFDPRAAIGMETLIHRADEAMYRAKAQGRNRVVAA